MPRHVNIRNFFIDDIGSLAVEVVNNLTDSLLVARNKFRG